MGKFYVATSYAVMEGNKVKGNSKSKRQQF